MSGPISAAGKASRIAVPDCFASDSCNEFRCCTQSGLQAKALDGCFKLMGPEDVQRQYFQMLLNIRKKSGTPASRSLEFR
jgi:hypothetical protein